MIITVHTNHQNEYHQLRIIHFIHFLPPIHSFVASGFIPDAFLWSATIYCCRQKQVFALLSDVTARPKGEAVSFLWDCFAPM